MKSILIKLHLGIAGITFFVLGSIGNLIALIIWLGVSQNIGGNLYSFSSVLTATGFLLILYEVILSSRIRRQNRFKNKVEKNPIRVTVVLTALNDEDSIGPAVEDFKNHARVERVVVIDNNSSDSTRACAEKAGASVIIEESRGYGHCVYRALSEGSSYRDTNFVALCEGDMTFRANDLNKLLAYTDHAEIVNGTRIVEQLRAENTQLSTFMYFGNFAVAKLMELKHLGKGTITDVGTTYKLLNSEFLRQNLHLFDRRINLEFNAHFLDKVMQKGFSFVEVPITFHPRIGESKGGNKSNLRALLVGLRMILGILTNWKWNASK